MFLKYNKAWRSNKTEMPLWLLHFGYSVNWSFNYLARVVLFDANLQFYLCNLLYLYSSKLKLVHGYWCVNTCSKSRIGNLLEWHWFIKEMSVEYKGNLFKLERNTMARIYTSWYTFPVYKEKHTHTIPFFT